jgi:beta-phosphoglucomutase
VTIQTHSEEAGDAIDVSDIGGGKHFVGTVEGGRRAFRACIFDFDGVIVDSEPLHASAKRMTLERFGIAFPATLFDDFKGRTDVDFFEHVVSHMAPTGTRPEPLLAEKDEIYAGLFADVPLMPGFGAFLAVARRQFDGIAIATSATRRDFYLVADRFDLASRVDVIVTGADTPRHKPDPAPYLEALARLAIEPDQALVVEDSPNGVRSARAAGICVIALTTQFAPEVLLSAGADRLVAGFDELTRIIGSIRLRPTSRGRQ